MSDETPSIIVHLILIFLLLVFIIFFVYIFNQDSKLNIFPSFTKVDKKIVWNEAYFLEYPGEIIYKIEGRDANIFLRYNPDQVIDYDDQDNVRGWEFSINGRDYFSVDNVPFNEYRDEGLTAKNREFLKLLINQGPEKGLQIMTERVIKNKEGNYWFDANLYVTIGSWRESFKASDKRLQDLDGVIDKLNQISRGVVKSRE